MSHARRGKFLFMVLLVGFGISACGQKGPLYREDQLSTDREPQPAATTAQAGQAVQGQSEQSEQSVEEKAKKSPKTAP